MIPLAIFTGVGTFAIFIKSHKITTRLNELLEIENEYYKLLEKTKIITGSELPAAAHGRGCTSVS